MTKILFPILAAVALLAASVSADDKLNQLKKDAEAGKADAQNNLGVMYADGQGVEKDYAEALKWFRKAAEQGLASAQSNLGSMYHNGEGVEKDYAEALKWYRKAAEQGGARAQRNLGLMYYKGEGAEKDYAEALKWYRKSAEQGLASAQHNLGLMYHNGEGVGKDYAEAYAWFNLAAANGDENAGKNRDALEKLMSPQQVTDSQKRTKELNKLIADKEASHATPKSSNIDEREVFFGLPATKYEVSVDESQSLSVGLCADHNCERRAHEQKQNGSGKVGKDGTRIF